MERVQPLLLSLDDGTLALIANQVGRRATRLRELCKALHSRLRRHLVCLRGNHGHSTFEFHFHVTKAALSRGAPLMSSFVSSDDLTPTIRVNETYWETWAFVLLVYQLEDPTSWPAFHPAAWPALPLIHVRKQNLIPTTPKQHSRSLLTARGECSSLVVRIPFVCAEMGCNPSASARASTHTRSSHSACNSLTGGVLWRRNRLVACRGLPRLPSCRTALARARAR